MGDLQPMNKRKVLAFAADLLGNILQQIHALCFIPAVLRLVLIKRQQVVMLSCMVMAVMIGEASVPELRSLRSVPAGTETPKHAKSSCGCSPSTRRVCFWGPSLPCIDLPLILLLLCAG